MRRTGSSSRDLKATYDGQTLRMNGNGVKLVFVKGNAINRLAFTSIRFRASGKVVRGTIHITTR